MNTLLQTDEFRDWLRGLKDAKAKARVIARLTFAENGNFGDCKPVGDGVSEMRVDVGPGYRLYYMRRGKVIYLLLMGGDKATQGADIAKAKKLARELED